MTEQRDTERVETVIIGGGQAGLTTGYHLGKRGRSFVILDAFERVGDAWRKGRWDSLRLFTPARYNGMPGMPFPAPGWSFPTKEEMASYMETYADRFHLNVRTGVTVDGLSRNGVGFVVSAGGRRFEADNVVVASGAHRIPKVPAFARELDPQIVQFHSSEYLRPSQLREGDVLIVGAGNSGAEIAHEVSKNHRTWIAGRDVGQIPVRHGSGLGARLLLPVIRFVGQHVLTKRTPIGRKALAKLGNSTPLIRVRRPDLAADGVERLPRMAAVKDGLPVLDDGRVMDVTNVIWCTGFRPDYGWIDSPVFAEDGWPLHVRGVVNAAPGLYFVGLNLQFSATSDVLPSRGRDARYVVKHIASRKPQDRSDTRGAPVAS
jgi:putative flavoprotein involved in K+ transport